MSAPPQPPTLPSPAATTGARRAGAGASGKRATRNPYETSLTATIVTRGVDPPLHGVTRDV